MVECQPTTYPEFSAIRATTGGIYHLKGVYQLQEDKRVLIPVNRSYSLDIDGARHNGLINIRHYRKDMLIHEQATVRDLKQTSELLFDVYGKPLLFLRSGGEVWYSSEYEINGVVSQDSRNIADRIKECLLKAGFSHSYRIGIFGSHQVGLNGVDSDVDLICWIKWDFREEFVRLVRESLKNANYQSTKETGKDAEYAMRYSKRLGVSLLGGWYLADKRMRWTRTDGVSISLQCLNSVLDQRVHKLFFDGLNDLWNSQEVILPCKVVSAEGSYNFPKTWKLDVNGRLIDAISFSWTHQGMGDDKEQFGDYLVKCDLVRTRNGEYLYLKKDNHYILPKSLL